MRDRGTSLPRFLLSRLAQLKIRDLDNRYPTVANPHLPPILTAP